MSSGVGYSYSYVDTVAQATRSARERIGRLNVRQAVAAAQADRIGALRARRPAHVSAVRPRQNATAEELEAAADRLEAALQRQEVEVAQALDDHWANALRRAAEKDQRAQRREQARAARAAPERPAAPSAQPAGAAAAGVEALQPADRTEQARAVAAQQVAAVLTELGPRCTPEDLPALDELFRGITDLSSTAAIRERVHEIRVAAATSTRRREAALRTETDRARLLALTEELAPQEREALNRRIAAAADPTALTAQVGEALERADAERRRRAVARITADRLRAMGCGVAEDFETSLTRGEATVAPFDGSSYGLLIRFTAGRDRIAAAVVRRDDKPADPERDVAAQREFCAEGLVSLTEGWQEAGLGLRSFHRTEPGDPPPAPYDARAWAGAGAAAADQAQAGWSATATVRARTRGEQQ